MQRRWYVFPLVVLSVAPAAACGDDDATSETSTTPPPTVEQNWDLVLMGDSVLLQPQSALRLRLEQDLGVELTVHDWINPDLADYTTGGERSADLLERLRTDEELRQDLAGAEVIIFDVPMGMLNDTCGSPDLPEDQIDTCWAEVPAVYAADVDAIFEEIVSLRDPADAIVRVTDVWQFLWPTMHRLGIYDAVRPAWQTMNQAVADAATRHGIPLVQAYATFTGTDGGRDPVAAGDVQSDEFHLTARGSDVFVDLVASLGYAPLNS